VPIEEEEEEEEEEEVVAQIFTNTRILQFIQ